MGRSTILPRETSREKEIFLPSPEILSILMNWCPPRLAGTPQEGNCLCENSPLEGSGVDYSPLEGWSKIGVDIVFAYDFYFHKYLVYCTEKWYFFKNFQTPYIKSLLMTMERVKGSEMSKGAKCPFPSSWGNAQRIRTPDYCYSPGEQPWNRSSDCSRSKCSDWTTSSKRSNPDCPSNRLSNRGSLAWEVWE